MKKTDKNDSVEDMRPEYDFSGGQRGKYADRMSQGSRVIVLDPDVASVFTDQESVNDALRSLARVVKNQIEKSGNKATG